MTFPKFCLMSSTSIISTPSAETTDVRIALKPHARGRMQGHSFATQASGQCQWESSRATRLIAISGLANSGNS